MKVRLTDYEVDITASHLLLLFDLIQTTQWKGWMVDDCPLEPSVIGKSKEECNASELFLLFLLRRIQDNIMLMRTSSTLPFVQYPLPTCQGILRGVLLICSRHPAVIQSASFFAYLMYLYYNMYRESLVVVADSSIYSAEEGEESTAQTDDVSGLLAKGPIQVKDEGLITEEDHIAKNKLDCRGHIIGEVDETQSKHLKKLMLSAWLICKHASLGIATLISLLPDSKFETCTVASYMEDLSQLTSYLKESSFVAPQGKSWFSSNDILFLLWNMMISVLTIKHIGGIIFVANSITIILQRLTKIAGQNAFIAGYPFSLVCNA